MTERDLDEQRWLQQLMVYVHENHLDRIGHTASDWQDFIRSYGSISVWRDAYDSGETPQDAWDSEMSYWEQ